MLIFKNAMTYNMKNSDIWNMAKKLKQFSKKEMAAILKGKPKKVKKSKTLEDFDEEDDEDVYLAKKSRGRKSRKDD